ncbi:MAG: TRAP transporter substrate-binding protein DctP [Chloroflexi bacterium]|nr:TRAP transporter substrate-binding protein DctP [Chloroflexota bacterium]
MSRKLIILGLLLALTALPLAVACAKAPTPTPAPTVTVTAPAPTSTPTPATTPTPTPEKAYKFTFAWDDAYGANFYASVILAPGREFQRLLYQRSNGRIQVNIISKMFPSQDIPDAVGDGRADMGSYQMAMHSGTFPFILWENIPGLVSADPVQGELEMMQTMQNARLIEIYNKVFREHGFLHLSGLHGGVGGFTLWSGKRVTTLAEMKGLKTRVSGAMANLALKNLGASPVTLAWAEVLGAVRTGVIDAVLTGLTYGFTQGLGDLAPYVLELPMKSVSQFGVVINAKLYDSLPPDLQKVLRDTMWEVQLMTIGNDEGYTVVYDSAKRAGITISRLSPEDMTKAVELMKPLEDEWLKTAGPYGPEILAIVKEELAKARAFEAYPK